MIGICSGWLPVVVPKAVGTSYSAPSGSCRVIELLPIKIVFVSYMLPSPRMKFLLFLLSIYLLALGCLPCADADCAGTETIVEAKATHTSDCHSEESCPPFCTCNCCSIQITAVNTTGHSTLPLQQEIAARPATLFDQPLITRAGNNIWQPPRAA
jgi:hypothetical protein